MSVNEANTFELEVLKQHISELEAKNTKIFNLRRKISKFDIEKAKLKCRIVKILRSTEKASK